MQTSNPNLNTVSADSQRCVECGQRFPKSELMAFAEFNVCAMCKPKVVEKISRGEPVGTFWNDGKRLVAPVNFPLPDRCVRCNEPAQGFRVKHQLYWHSPAYYVLLALSPIIYILVAVAVRKSSKTEVGLCPAHRGLRTKKSWIFGGVMFAGFAGVAVAIGSGISGPSAGWLGGISALAFLVGAIGLSVVRRTAVPTRITRTHVFLKGVCPAYLGELPGWTGE